MPLQVSVVTPEREVWAGESDFVAARPEGGELGVLPGHAPFLGVLLHSHVKIQDGSGEHLMAVHGGFIEVYQDHVTILAREAELAEEIDVQAAREAKERSEQALRSGHTDEAYEELLRAEARLRTAGEAGLIVG
jgi:F-type H+-transporting ATPase subunit epsilon